MQPTKLRLAHLPAPPCIGLGKMPNQPRRALFVHVGGLSGLLAQAGGLEPFL
jgi:hypothetical protein